MNSASLNWALRRTLWEILIVGKYAANKPVQIPVPQPQEQKITYVPLIQSLPDVGATAVLVADHVPSDEAKPANRRFYAFQMGLSRAFAPQLPGLPPVDPDPNVRLSRAYGTLKRRLFPMPQLPPPFEGSQPDLGELAVAGPYFGYLKPSGENQWHWDLRELAGFEHWPGLYNLGCRVVFEIDPARRALAPSLIECELGAIRPDDPQWPLARAIALCGLTTHVSLVRHFNGVHLALGAKVAIAARNQLPWDHPVLRLLWPHIYGSQYSNELATWGQMAETGDFPNTFSFTPRGLWDLFDKTHGQIKLSDYDPEAYVREAGLDGVAFGVPSGDNLCDIFALLKDHASNYIHSYYASDAELAADAAIRGWLRELRASISTGIPVDPESVTRDDLAGMIALFIYTVVVEHELRGTFLWNYQLWTHMQPIRVYRSREREPVDVYQRLVNTNMLLNINRAPLGRDFSYLALDERGRLVFSEFRRKLNELQSRMQDEPRQVWKLYPDMLNANMNA